MRAVGAILIFASLLVGAFIERRASLCGAGLFSTELPYGLKAEWFNGTFWLTDSDGWGVVAPPVDLDIGEESDLHVQRVNRYTIDHGFVIEVVLDSGESAFLSISASGPEAIRISRLEPGALDIKELPWTSVLPRSCFYGRVGVARVPTVLVLLSGLLLLLRSRRENVASG
jgi:hypothetical protein